MDQLTTINDISASILGLAPVVLAAVVVLLILRYPRATGIFKFEISTRLYALIMVFAVGILAFLLPFLRFSVQPPGGADFYFARALNIIRHGVFGNGDLPNALFPPGYSFLMIPAALVFGDSSWAFFLTNAALLVGSSVAVRFLLQRTGMPRGRANLISLLVFLYPNRLISTLLPFSDIPFSLIYLCAFLLMILSAMRPEGKLLPIAAGLVAGVAALVRATGVPLILPLAIGLWWPANGSSPGGSDVATRRFRVRNVSLLLAAAFVVLLPWSIRNVMLFGKVIPVSNNFGVNLAIGNNPGAGVTHNGYIDSLARVPGEWRRMGGGSGWNDAQVDSFLLRKGMEYIREQPLSFLVRGFGKVFHTMASDASSFGQHQTYANLSTLVYRIAEWLRVSPSATAVAYAAYATAYRLLFVVNNTFYYVVFAFMLLVLVRHRRRPSGPELAYVAVILITCGLTFVLFGNSRFKEPIPSLTLVLLAVEGIKAARGKQKTSVKLEDAVEVGD